MAFILIRRRRQRQQKGVVETSNEINSNDDGQPTGYNDISHQTQSPPPQYMQYNIQQEQQQHAPHQQVTGTMISPMSNETFPPSGGFSSSSQSHTSPTMLVPPSHQEQYYIPNLRLEPVKPDGGDP